MKKDRRLKVCLNCGRMLSPQDNFCPECGQKNLDQRVSLSVFLQDFFSNYLSFDTTIFRTLKPFLFNPGKLTTEFNAGKRNFYIHPIRLYLIFSLFYFFIISVNVPANSVDTLMNNLISSVDNKVIMQELDSAQRKKVAEAISKNGVVGLDSISMFPDSSEKPMKWSQWKAYAIDDDITDSAFSNLLDRHAISIHSSLGVGVEKTRAFIANSNLYLISALRNLPIMMFVLLPLFALFLMVLHFRRKIYYVEHLIHAIHLHAFAYMLYGFGLLLIIHVEVGEVLGWTLFLCFFIVSLYSFLSIRKVYNNGFLKAFFKFSFLGFVYLLFLMIAVGIELSISLMLL